jgi:hypothetical protein
MRLAQRRRRRQEGMQTGQAKEQRADGEPAIANMQN